MILILASIVDEAAAAFAKEFPGAAASVLTCFDLAGQKTCLRYPDFHKSAITAGGRSIYVSEIRGVINLLPAVFPAELFFFPPEEREYQSAEFHALLTFFLCALQCPVWNRPTALSLNGPALNPMSWLHLAAQLQIPFSTGSIDTADPATLSSSSKEAGLLEVLYCGGTILPSDAGAAASYTRMLGDRSGVGYLKACYEQDASGEVRFVRAHTTPALKDTRVRAALLDCFRPGA